MIISFKEFYGWRKLGLRNRGSRNCDLRKPWFKVLWYGFSVSLLSILVLSQRYDFNDFNPLLTFLTFLLLSEWLISFVISSFSHTNQKAKHVTEGFVCFISSFIPLSAVLTSLSGKTPDERDNLADAEENVSSNWIINYIYSLLSFCFTLFLSGW